MATQAQRAQMTAEQLVARLRAAPAAERPRLASQLAASLSVYEAARACAHLAVMAAGTAPDEGSGL